MRGQAMLNHVVKIRTINTGGNCMVDLLFLEDGKIIGISADVAVLYPSIEDFEDQTGDEDYPCIDLT